MQPNYEHMLRMEEMVQLLIRMIGKSNEKITLLEERLVQIESSIKSSNNSD
ncbi:hypothetical protein [Bacillus andreraoultii]|uniref:hypothetical protein n=1 Tax=Bacillus andreraoultii TaxID=1499685 RepID=UPI000AFA4C3C|nr:hypothetical protein [Bacillus andreraoultii]